MGLILYLMLSPFVGALFGYLLSIRHKNKNVTREFIELGTLIATVFAAVTLPFIFYLINL